MSHKRVARTVITLKEKVHITPHFIRGIFTGENLEQYSNTTVGDNNKIFIPPQGLNEVHFSTIHEATGETVYPPEEVKPVLRTYTHRHLDLEKNELHIDFVNHGDNGPASAWINNAVPGDKIGVAMRLDPKELFNPGAENYLLAGDATAIPVLASILEKLPASSRVQCFIEVHGPEDEQVLETRARAEFTWLHNPSPEKGSQLATVVKEAVLPTEKRFAYIASEFSTVKELRIFLRKEKKWAIDELFAYSYWKAGFAESESVSERKAEKES